MQVDLLKWLFKRRGEQLTPGERRHLFFGGAVGALLVVVLNFGVWNGVESYGWFERLSYDVPHLFKQLRPPEVRMVYMSESAARNLNQSFGIWNRSIHARLIRRLKEEGAKAVFFDLVLLDPYDTLLQELEVEGGALDDLRRKYLAIDAGLHEAIREHGRVYFGAMFDPREKSIGGMDVSVRQVMLPHDALLETLGDHWGLLAVNPIDSDYCVRRYFGGIFYVPSATWVLANDLGAGLGDAFEERSRERWLNYYGPPESISPDGTNREFTFDAQDYDAVLLRPKDRPADFFRDKVVFVGLKNQLGTVNVGKDEFRHPTSRWTNRYCNGVEVHATAFLNLLKHEWLTRFDRTTELWLTLAFGAVLTILAARLAPALTITCCLLAAGLLAGVGVWSQLMLQVWFNWSLSVVVSAPFAMIWGISTRYIVVERRRAGFRRALANYLSEDVAAAMVDQGFELKLGGENRIATTMFTDLEGFTTLSQALPPQKVAEVLSAYFQRTNRHIQENRGAIIRYIGDAILAVWNAPRDCPDHAERACLAAREIARLNAEPLLVDGTEYRLRTRIGIHTGEMIACNVGSEDRMDYTVLGDNVNLAARLEGLNKYFGTTAIVTGETVRGIRSEIVTRAIGAIVVKGRTEAVEIFELAINGLDEARQERFVQALEDFARGEIATAESSLEQLAREDPRDGPVQFYLSRIKKGKTEWPPAMDEK